MWQLLSRAMVKGKLKTFGSPRAIVVAFTLVELLVVLTIISVLAGGVMVAFRGRQETYAVKTAAKELVAAVRGCQRASAQRHRPYRLAFGSLFRSFRMETLDEKAGDTFVPAHGMAGRTRQMPNGVFVAEIIVDGCRAFPMPEFVEFQPGGHGFHGELQLQNRDQETATIHVTDRPGEAYVVQ